MTEDNFKLPNVRNLFIPDPGYTIIDCDLSGADAQVVAWEANDAELKHAFRNGLDVHTANGHAIWGDAFRPKAKLAGRKFEMRDECKRAVHATNYGGSSKTVATTLGWKIREAEAFQATWFKLHPGIRDWHRRTERKIQTSRTITNAFNYRCVYFDRVDGLLPEALAWVPQSTVGIVTSKAGVNLYKNLPWVQLLLQVHDSLVFQIPNHKFEPSSLEVIKRHLDVVIPYPDPLIIPWGLAYSHKSWGECKKAKWDLSNE